MAEDRPTEMHLEESLTVFVIGASGDLAKKKTYPALLKLYEGGFINDDTLVIGYARTDMTSAAFREKMSPLLMKGVERETVDKFLQLCVYSPSPKGYADLDGMKAAVALAEKHEADGKSGKGNRLYYFAIPPSAFTDVAGAIKEVGISTTGWTRVIVEKPFGKDLESFEQLSTDMSKLFPEEMIYRIDHYLGKEMTQNLSSVRFSNAFLEPIWNRNYISSVMITFKENFGTQGRGGYFDEYGIIRDVMQNHLTQLLTLFAMEPPARFSGAASSEFVRDEKMKVLRAMQPVSMDEVVVGQYLAGESEPAYTDDPTVPDGSKTPTFATIVLRINNSRWEGVPFIMRAGKALNERKSEVRVQFREAPAASFMFDRDIPRNELVMRLQPEEAIYIKTNIKKPGLTNELVTTELDLSYKNRLPEEYSKVPEAYTRLILDCLRSDHSSFVRDDELRASWEVFTPILKQVDAGKVPVIPYKFGSRGPDESDELVKRVGFVYDATYTWRKKSAM